MRRLNPLAILRRLRKAGGARRPKGKIRVGPPPGPPQPAPPVPGMKPKPPAGVQAPSRGRPANNTTCDVYRAPNAPPAAPDVAGVPCALLPAFREGAEASEGDQDLRYTHVLFCDAATDIRDDYPSPPTNHSVYVPDKNGTRFDVVFVEKVNRGLPSAHLRVYLDRPQPTWPTQEL